MASHLKAREFLFLCEELAFEPPAGPPRGLTRKLMWTILQYQYPNPAVHFELQPQPSRGLVELGLHFEGPVETNDALAAVVAAASGELLPALGEGWELEAWTASWRRLHRPFPFETLTRELAADVSHGLSSVIATLDPLIRDLPETQNAPPRRAATPVTRSRRRVAASR
ncbi:MAG: hypothetical protein ACKVVT_00205 [Dehalococcoidia bacterium]